MQRYKFFFTTMPLLGLIVLTLSLVFQITHDTVAAGNQRPPQGNNSMVEKDIDPPAAMFVENVGQFDESARFKVNNNDHTIWVADDAIWVTLLEPTKVQPEFDKAGLSDIDVLPQTLSYQTSPNRRGVNIRLSFIGANITTELQPLNPQISAVSYFIGNDPEKWASNVPVSTGIRYINLYPGLDLELDGIGGSLSMQIVCRHTECLDALNAVQLQLEGAESVAMDGTNMLINTAVGAFHLPLLHVVDKNGRPISTIDSPDISKNETLVTRPFRSTTDSLSVPMVPNDDLADLLYGTYLGGNFWDSGQGIVVNSSSQTYVTGYTESTDFPTTPGAFDITHNNLSDIFVAKLDADGSELVYSTFIGGSESDSGNNIFIDGSDQVYVTGQTSSPNFPTTAGAIDESYNDNGDAFVVKLNAAGNGLLYGTYLGAEDDDRGQGITVDNSGQAIVSGSTDSIGFPTTTGAFDTTFNGESDVFVAKLNLSGSQLIYSTYIGGDGLDTAFDIALDGTDQTYVTGFTQSNDFPTSLGAYDTSYGGSKDAFVVNLNASGTDISYATYLGGNGDDRGYGITADNMGFVYITGPTTSSNFPTTSSAFDQTANGASDAFLTKLNQDGTDLIYSTYLGGGGNEYGTGVAVDGTGKILATGYTASTDFPTTYGAFDSTLNGNSDIYLVALSDNQQNNSLPTHNLQGQNLVFLPLILRSNPNPLLYATFIGGAAFDAGSDITIDTAGNAYIVGTTYSDNFPTTPGAFDTTLNNPTYLSDSYVVKLFVD